MNRFGFIDSSGILKTDPFLGTGLLVVRNVGDITDKLCKNGVPAKQIVNANKKRLIENLVAAGNHEEAVRILMSNARFEMKFDNVRASIEKLYEKMIDIFFSDAENRFSATVVKRLAEPHAADGMDDTWETYTDFSADLVLREMKALPNDSLCVVVDEISRPRKKSLSLEDTLLAKIRNESARDSAVDFSKVFGALSIESHSNFLLQLCDILLGAVVYDYKRQAGLVSMKISNRKEHLVNRIRQTLKVKTLGAPFEVSTPAFFSVSEMSQSRLPLIGS